MRTLITSDFHWSDRPADAYRWDVVSFLIKQMDEFKPKALFILGDLTHDKNNHSAALVNRVVAELQKLACYAPVYLLKGNHDYEDPTLPFFYFVQEQSYPHKVAYVSEKKTYVIGGKKYLFLPHSKTPEIPDGNYDLVFMHQTVKGARMESGVASTHGMEFELIGKQNIVSGDVHVPQTIASSTGSITYVGAPHPINFGDDFEPRVLLHDNNKLVSIKRCDAVRKLIVNIKRPTDIEDAHVRDGDMIKIVLTLPRSEFMHDARYRKEIKSICDNMKLKLCGIAIRDGTPDKGRTPMATTRDSMARPETTLRTFGAFRGLSEDLISAGLRILED